MNTSQFYILLIAAAIVPAFTWLIIRLRKLTAEVNREKSFTDLFEQQEEAWFIFDGESLNAKEANQKALNMFGIFKKNKLREFSFKTLFNVSLPDDEANLLLHAVDNHTFNNKSLECISRLGRVFHAKVSVNRINEGDLFCRISETPLAIVHHSSQNHEPVSPPPPPAPTSIQTKTNNEMNIAPSAIRISKNIQLSDDSSGQLLINDQQQIIKVNSTICKWLNYQPDQLQLFTVRDITHHEDVAHDMLVKLFNDDMITVSGERRLLPRDGEPVFVRYRAARTAPDSAIIYFENFTEKKEHDRLLGQTKENLSALIENTTEAIFAVDVLYQITVINSVFQKLFLRKFGIELKEGDSIIEKLPLKERAEWKQKFEQVARGAILTYETEEEADDKTKSYFEISLYPVSSSDGLITGISYFARNNTERINQQRELELAKDKAEQATAAKSFFLATMSHEIRTPLNGLIGLADLLRTSGKLDPQQNNYVNKILQSGETLLQVVNDVLDFSKIEAEMMQLEKAPFPLEHLINESLDVLSIKAQEKGLVLKCNIQPNVPHIISSDKGRLRQILTNLIGNAVKFSDKGEIRVDVKLLGEQNKEVELQFAVCDSGIGIPADRIENLFKPFSQADRTTYRKFGGTGLGLTISKQIVNLMGGRIWVESKPNEGSVFYFTILANKGELPNAYTIPAFAKNQVRDNIAIAKQFPLRILVAEDNDINQLLVKNILKQLGYDAVMVSNGLEALETVRKEMFDIVLMDVQMPEMDGLEATRSIQQEISKDRQPIIIAMTAFAMDEDKQRCLDAGMQDYISKPILIEDIQHIIMKWSDIPGKKNDGTRFFEEVELIDPNALSRLTSIAEHTDVGFLTQVMNMFLSQAPLSITDIIESYRAENYTAMWQSAHKLKGTCINMGAKRLGEVCRQIEIKGKNMQMNHLKEYVSELEHVYRLTVDALQEKTTFN